MLNDTLSLLRERMEMLEAREESSPRVREEDEMRALSELESLGATLDRAGDQVTATMGPPHPLFPSPIVCRGDDLKDVLENVLLLIKQYEGLPILRRGS
jgi:hypothetical protein